MVCPGHTAVLEGQLRDQGSGMQLLVEPSGWCKPAHTVTDPLVSVARNTSSIKTSSTGKRICFCWWRNAFKSHLLACVFMLVKASCVDLGCLCIFSVLLSLWLSVYLWRLLCVLQRCQDFCQLFQWVHSKKLCPVKCALKAECARGVILLKSTLLFSVG